MCIRDSFTSISLAIGSIADIRTMGRISAKTLFWFLLCSFLALLLAGCVGYGTCLLYTSRCV